MISALHAHVPIQRDQSIKQLPNTLANGRPMGPLHCQDGMNKEWDDLGPTKEEVRITQ